MILKIDVNEKDISEGIRGSEKSCALAKAIKRHFPGAFSVDVRPSHDIQSGTSWSASIHSYNFHLSFDLKNEFVKFAEDFDRGLKVNPCILELDLTK